MTPIARERLAGWFWLAAIVPTAFAYGHARGTLVVSGDAAATAALIAAHQILFREWIAAVWIANLLMLLFGATLYPSLRESDRTLARLFLLALASSVTVAMAMTAILDGAVLVLADDIASPLGTVVAPLSALFTRLANSALAVSELLSAPAYAALGLILFRSRRAPRPIGVALVGMGLGFVLNSFEKLLAPDFHPDFFTQLAMALGAIGGLPAIAWLSVKGLSAARRDDHRPSGEGAGGS